MTAEVETTPCNSGLQCETYDQLSAGFFARKLGLKRGESPRVVRARCARLAVQNMEEGRIRNVDDSIIPLVGGTCPTRMRFDAYGVELQTVYDMIEQPKPEVE